MRKLAVVAIGGNAIIRAGQRGTTEEQLKNADETCRQIVGLVQENYAIVLTHGNGPQVGAALMRSELAATQVYTHALDVCDAETQGSMGYLLQVSMRRNLAQVGLERSVATVITQVLVDRNDPAFENPTKPIGPFYSREEALRRQEEFGWVMVEDADRGYRRVVPSPTPLDIVELDVIQTCVEHGIITIAVGGGGIPVIQVGGDLVGVEAVIDKDRASALLGKLLKSEMLVIPTAEEYVYLNYRKPGQRPLQRMTLSEAGAYSRDGQFPPGNMGPKIESAIDFLENGGREVIITTPEKIVDALHGRTGTHIVP